MFMMEKLNSIVVNLIIDSYVDWELCYFWVVCVWMYFV